MLDEMAQALGGVGGEVENVLEFVLREQLFHERGIRDRAFHELHAGRNIIPKAAAQIVQADNLMALLQQMPANMRANETRHAGDQNL
jgi:hypothetical protein